SASRSTSTQAGRSAEASSSASLGGTRGGAAGSSSGNSSGRRSGSSAVRTALTSEGRGGVKAVAVEVAEAGGLAEEDERHAAGLAVPVLGDDQLGETLLVGVVRIVDLVAIDEPDEVGVLLDGSALTKIRKLRPVVVAAPLGLAGELRERDHRQLELFGELLEPPADGGDLQVAVLVAAARLHQLEVVEDDEGETLLGFEAPRLRSDLEEGRVRRVVDEERGVRGRAHDLVNLRPLLVRESARAQARERDVGLRAEDAQSQLLLAHLEREDPHRPLLADRHVLGDVERQAGLAHARARRDDDQVAAVQAVGDPVEVGEPCRDADQRRAGPLLELLERLVEDGRERDEAALDRLLAEPEDRLLGAPERGGGLEPAVQAVFDDPRRGVDQPAADRALLDDLDVGVDPAEIRQVEVEARDVGDAAGLLELPLLLELRLHRPQVDADLLLLELEHDPVEDLVPVAVEVLRPQAPGDRRQLRRVEHHPGEHGALGLLALRQGLRWAESFEHRGEKRTTAILPHREGGGQALPAG